ncbi:MAG: 4-(cytidine 5'-diphospho)-2-C-methyl-D-erythritol kinase [Candidatus Binatia bacterium]
MSISRRTELRQRIFVAAPAKLNLCLQIVGSREDGYHLLDSILVPIRLCDYVAIAIRRRGAADVELVCEPADAAPPGADNLAARAAELYCARTGWRPRLRIELRKVIPVGAGLGGGSSDAAAVLRGLNAISDKPVSRSELAAWALELGADVPFFVYGRAARMRGIGERLDPITPPLPAGHPVVVAFPGIGLNTREVYARYDDSLTSREAASTIRQLTFGQGPLGSELSNDLEDAALQVLPALGDLKRQLQLLGARGVRMTGSGSAVFGVWNRAGDARAAAAALREAGTWARATEVIDRIPAIDMDEDIRNGRSPSW